MQNSMDKDEASGGHASSLVEEHSTPGERVTMEPVDEYGIIFWETRIAADGTKRVRKVNKRGVPVLSVEDRLAMDHCPLPPEPDCWA